MKPQPNLAKTLYIDIFLNFEQFFIPPPPSLPLPKEVEFYYYKWNYIQEVAP